MVPLKVQLRIAAKVSFTPPKLRPFCISWAQAFQNLGSELFKLKSKKAISLGMKMMWSRH